MNNEEKLELKEDYIFKVMYNGFPFDGIRPELEQTTLSKQEISKIIKEIDDGILLNSVDLKLEERRYKYEKSGVGILFTLIFFLCYFAYSYNLIKIGDVEFGAVILVFFIASFFFYRKVKKPKGKFINRNKFKND